MQASMVRALGESVSGGSVVAQETNVKSSLRTRSARALAAGALSVALLTSGAAAAFAADPAAPASSMSADPMMSKSKSADPMMSKSKSADPMSKSPMASPKPTRTHKSTMKPAAASITVRASKTSVKAGQSDTFTGTTKGLKVGSALSLQRFNGTKWVTLKTATVKKDSSYTAAAKLTTKGKQKLRVTNGTTMSPAVTVTVK
jgi:hypothetical protein